MLVMLIFIALTAMTIIAVYDVVINIKVVTSKMKMKSALKKAGFCKGAEKGHWLTVAYNEERRLNLLKNP